MRTGIFGFPKVGKTTLFNLMTRQGARVEKFSKGRAAPNVGRAVVADRRIRLLAELYRPKKTTFAAIDYVDLAGYGQGELKDSVDLAELKPVDALVHVVRAFADPEIDHAPGPLDPARDIRQMEDELLLADLISVERRLERLAVETRKRRDPQLEHEREALEIARVALDDGRPLRAVELGEDEAKRLRGFQFLTAKPILHVINLGEERPVSDREVVTAFGLEALASHPTTAVTYVLGQLEMEIAELDEAAAAAFLADLGLEMSGLDRIIRASYDLLGLVSFFTVGEDEVRAWTIRRGTTARKAAGVVHTDIERGFIRAEVTRHDDLLSLGSEKAARAAGRTRLESKDYQVEDGDVAHFRFAV